MKVIFASAVVAAFATAALAQPRPGKTPPPPPPQNGPPPVAAALYPCRSEKEVCYVGVVKDGRLVVLFTNDPKTDEITGKPLPVTAADGGPDLGPSEGRLVMMIGSYDAKSGLSKAEIVDTASPLAAFAIKAALGGGGDDAEGPVAPPPPPPPPGKKR